MATEVSVKVRDSNLGQALFIKGEEWDLCLSEIRAILIAQEVETPSRYRFLTGNGNVVSATLEDTVIFRDIVENEPFAEIKKEDTSLQSAEERVTPQVMIMPVDSSAGEGTEKQCPFINKFPIFTGARDTLPCMRYLFNIHTLLKMAFILTCILFLLIFVLTLFLHLFFGIGTFGGLAGHGILGGSLFHQQSKGSLDQEVLTSLRVKISEVEVANRFEIQDLKRKLAEFGDMNLSLFKELEATKKELAAVTSTQSSSGMPIAEQISDLSFRIAEVHELVDSRKKSFILPEETRAFNKAVEEAFNGISFDKRIEQAVMKLKASEAIEEAMNDIGMNEPIKQAVMKAKASEAVEEIEMEALEFVEEKVDTENTEEGGIEEGVVNQENKEAGETETEIVKEEIEEEGKIEDQMVDKESKKDKKVSKENKKEDKVKKEKKNKEEKKDSKGDKKKNKEDKKKNKEDKTKNKDGKEKNKGKDKKKEKKTKK